MANVIVNAFEVSAIAETVLESSIPYCVSHDCCSDTVGRLWLVGGRFVSYVLDRKVIPRFVGGS